MKKFCYTHLLNSKNSLRLGTYYQNNFVLFKSTLENSRLLTTSPIIQNDNQDENNEILKTYQIPGRYLHYFKKSKRQLKKDARETSRFGDESTTRISARKLRLLTKNTDMNTELENKDKDNDDNSSLPFKGNFSAQQNIIQRLSRAIIKCNDDVPHNYLSSTFVRIININVSPELNIARVLWRPDSQKGISESKIENTMNKYSIKYRNILQRSMNMRNPPKIVFLRYDKTLGNINELLDKIEEELKEKEK